MCLFCKIASHEIPGKTVLETDRCIAFHDIHPQAPVHVLVIPKEHVASLAQVSDASLIADVMMMAQQVARELGIEDAGYRVVLNIGSDGGQTVSHLHAHVLGGRCLAWPPG